MSKDLPVKNISQPPLNTIPEEIERLAIDLSSIPNINNDRNKFINNFK